MAAAEMFKLSDTLRAGKKKKHYLCSAKALQAGALQNSLTPARPTLPGYFVSGRKTGRFGGLERPGRGIYPRGS